MFLGKKKVRQLKVREENLNTVITFHYIQMRVSIRRDAAIYIFCPSMNKSFRVIQYFRRTLYITTLERINKSRQERFSK